MDAMLSEPFRPLSITGVPDRTPKFTPLSITKPVPKKVFDFGGLSNPLDFLPPKQKDMAAVTSSGQQMVVEAPPYWQLPSVTRRQFLAFLATGSAAAAYAYLKNQIPALPQASSAVHKPSLIESPPQNPATSAAGTANAGELKNSPAVIESVSRFDRAYTIVQSGKETVSPISSNFFPDYMLNQTALAEARLNTMAGEPIVRNSLRLAPSSDPNDRSLVDYIVDKFDDPAYGFIQDGKLQNYTPPKELGDGTKEYAILDEKGPTVVDWMWFTNKNYKDHYAAMGNIRIYADDKLVVNMPAADYFRAQKLPQMQGYNWTFNQAKATGSYYPIYGNKSLRICFTEKPQWFDIRGMKLKEPFPYPSSFTQQPSSTEIQSARKMDTMRNQPENYIDMIDGVERRQGINIKAKDKNVIEFKNQFRKGSTIDSFHLTVDSRQLQKLSYIHIYVDGERTVTVPIADLFHISYDSSGKLVDHKSVFAGVIRQSDGTAELYLNTPFSFKKGVRFEIENTDNTEITVLGKFKTTDKFIPSKLNIKSQEGTEVDIKGKGKLLRLDWDITAPRKYRLPNGQMSDEDEIFDQNPTTVLDGFEERSTGDEDWTGHGFYWALWSTRSALPGGMVLTNADSQKRRTRFYRQYLSNFEGTFNSTAKLKLPIPDVTKDKIKVRSTVMYYTYESPNIFDNLSSPEVEKRRNLFFVGAHAGEMYLSTNPSGYPIGIKRKVLEEFSQKFILANPQIKELNREIPMTFNINPTFIRAGLLPELLIIARENGIRPRLILQASNQEAMGIDEASYNRGKTLAEDVQDAINVLKKIDKNYPPLSLAFTNEPNLTYEEPFPSPGWTGTGRAEDGGKLLYKACQHFLQKCPDVEIGLPALVIVGRHPNVIKSSHTYAREFFEEVTTYGLPKNVKQIYVNAFGDEPLNALVDVAYVPTIWQNEAEKLGLKQDQIPQEIFVTEMGPGDDPDGSGNENRATVPFLERLAEMLAQIKEEKGSLYEYILKSEDPYIKPIIPTLPKVKGMTLFTWYHDGSKMTFHPEIKFRFK